MRGKDQEEREIFICTFSLYLSLHTPSSFPFILIPPFLSLSLQDKGGPSLQRSNSSGPSPSASTVSLPHSQSSSSSSSHPPPSSVMAHVATIPNGPVHPSTTSPNNVIRPQLPIRKSKDSTKQTPNTLLSLINDIHEHLIELVFQTPPF